MNVLWVPLLLAPLLGEVPAKDFTITPASLHLNGLQSRYRLLVDGAEEGVTIDLTHQVAYRSLDPKIVTISQGMIHAIGAGKTKIEVSWQGTSKLVEVVVADSGAKTFHFEQDIIPLMSRFGCNASGCHGQAEGQNGFKLSVFGFDPVADLNAMIKEARGRRVFPAAPDSSLLLLKASGAMAHGGGNRIKPGTVEYDTLRSWIVAGAPFKTEDRPELVGIRVEPSERLMRMKGSQQLRVMARFADGHEEDVSSLSKFQSNNDGLASVNEDGLVSIAEIPGEVAIMANYLGAVDTFRAIVPRAEKVDFPKLAEANFIDKHVHDKLRKLNILPSEPASDAEFLRRVYLDILGTLPTTKEARAFLNDKSTDKRAKLIDGLLERPEYADYWALYWSDVLRVDRQTLGPKRAYQYYRWIRQSFAQNQRFDHFAQELLQAEGPLDEVGPANFYKVTTKPGETASSLSQIFLGVRIACAECHHHPFDRWSQTDYFGMQSFFTPLAVKKVGNSEFLEATGTPISKHPRTGDAIHPHPLGQPMPGTSLEGERRENLAKWLTAAENPWFAKNLANRMWAHFLGRGLIDPVDDIRDTNPPSNPQLLQALSEHLIAKEFDVKALIRAITNSHTYQRTSKPQATNVKDEINASRALFRRFPAEVLLDMVSQTTGISERFKGMPAEVRAIQLWDSKAQHYFLKLYGRPQRLTACECERVHEPSVSQVLHLLNSPEIHGKLSHDRGTIAQAERNIRDDRALIEEIYLTYYSRVPTDQEFEVAQRYLTIQPRRQAAEDLAWSLMNSLEFVFNH